MDITISKYSSIPLHQQLLNEMRRCILSGEWQPGKLVPSELTLQRQLGISRSTIRQALTAARNEGLIEAVPGKGTFVSPDPTQHLSPRLVGFVIPYFRSSFDTLLLKGAESVLRSADYRIIFSTSDSNAKEEDRLLWLLRRDRVAGILLWPVMDGDSNRFANELARQQVHLVLMDRNLPGVETDLVMSDNFNGGCTATQHLISLGHRKIAFLCRQHLNLLPVAERLRGYRQAMRDAGLAPLDPVLIPSTQEMTTEYALRSYSEARSEDILLICQYIDQPDRATALFASNDLTAIQVLRAAELVHIRIPQDLSLVGFDDLDFCSHLTVPLTTIAQDPYKLGFEAASLLLKRMEGKSVGSRQVILPTQLVHRASTAAPGQD